jgi:FkbM family methyltransferase
VKFLNVNFKKETFTILVKYLQETEIKGKIVISDLLIDCVYFIWDVQLNKSFDGWVVPFNEKINDTIINSKSFYGFNVKLYNEENRLLQVEKILVNDSVYETGTIYATPEFDVTGPSYVDFFYGDLCKNIDTSGTVIDAGANVGFFTLYCKKHGSKRIYSIEPDPMPFFYLEKNYGFDPGIILLNKVLNDTEQPVSFDICIGASVGSAISKYTNYENKQSVLVESVTINSILKIENRINLLKLDIEGAEFDVIEKLTANEFDKIDQMFIEFHSNPKVIESTLINNNYFVEYRNSTKEDTVGFIYAKKR